MNRITLTERLSHLKDGKASDLTLYESLLQNIANMTLADYLSGDAKLLASIAEAFELREDMDKVRGMTYGEAVQRIAEMWNPDDHESAMGALIDLTRPYHVEYLRREKK